jgi:hypothetical protein
MKRSAGRARIISSSSDSDSSADGGAEVRTRSNSRQGTGTAGPQRAPNPNRSMFEELDGEAPEAMQLEGLNIDAASEESSAEDLVDGIDSENLFDPRRERAAHSQPSTSVSRPPRQAGTRERSQATPAAERQLPSRKGSAASSQPAPSAKSSSQKPGSSKGPSGKMKIGGKDVRKKYSELIENCQGIFVYSYS